MGIVTSALHGLLNTFQWLQHVIAANWLTIGDGQCCGSQILVILSASIFQGCTGLPQPIYPPIFRRGTGTPAIFHGKFVYTRGIFRHISLPSLHATISHYLRGWKLLFYLTKAMQWPRNPTEKIQKKLCGSPWKVGRLKVITVLWRILIVVNSD